MNRNLLLRVATAVVGLPVVIGAALWQYHEGWWLLGTVALALVLWEFGKMSFPGSVVDRLFLVLLGVFFTAFLMAWPNYFFLVYGWAALAIIMSLVFSREPVQSSAPRMGAHFIGIFYISQSFFFLMRMHGFPAGGWWILYTLAAVWSCDTGAYFTGRALGKHKLAPHISPKKTWEGAIGGAAASVLSGVLFAVFVPQMNLSPLTGALLALFASTMGQIGDLAESLIKRTYGVKDSGSILPGHGGMFDRVDALIAASPVVFGFMWLNLLRTQGL